MCSFKSLIWFAVYGTAEVWLPNQLLLISIGSDTCLNMSELEMTKHDQPPNFSDPKSSEILRSNPCDLARPVAISSGVLRTEATSRCTVRLRAATWRWSRRCWLRAPPSRRRIGTAAALRDGTDATGRTWWEGGAADFRMKFGGVRHLSRRWTSSRYEPQGGYFEGNQAHEVMKLSLLGCTASERWFCTCATLINPLWV